jgi:hypothetical protein
MIFLFFHNLKSTTWHLDGLNLWDTATDPSYSFYRHESSNSLPENALVLKKIKIFRLAKLVGLNQLSLYI